MPPCEPLSPPRPPTPCPCPIRTPVTEVDPRNTQATTRPDMACLHAGATGRAPGPAVPTAPGHRISVAAVVGVGEPADTATARLLRPLRPPCARSRNASRHLGRPHHRPPDTCRRSWRRRRAQRSSRSSPSHPVASLPRRSARRRCGVHRCRRQLQPCVRSRPHHRRDPFQGRSVWHRFHRAWSARPTSQGGGPYRRGPGRPA